MSGASVVARKEILDHLRDRRSLLSSALMALMGPGVVLLVSLSGRIRGQEGEQVLLGMLSIFALVSSFAGAVNIAMDTMAGERERHSLMPLLLNPVTGRNVILGKWIAVTAFALAAVGLNSVGMAVVLWSAAPALLASLGPRLFLWFALGLLPLSALGAAMCLLTASLCRTTKEAHGALTFLVFVPMLVGMFLVFFPAWAGRVWFLLPIAGQQALVGLRESSLPIGRSLILALVTLAAAGVALAGATRVLNGDDVRSA